MTRGQKNYLRHSEHIRKYIHDRALKFKAWAILGYGGKCKQCGEIRIACLDFDHINNDGAQHRRELKLKGPDFHKWIIINQFPDTLQVLCANCHRLKHCSYPTKHCIEIVEELSDVA